MYVLDSSTIDLCLSVFPWALFRSTKSAIKLHILLDLRGSIPAFVNALDPLIPEAGAFYVMDRGYLDFGRLFKLNNSGAFFVARAKSNTQFCRRYSRRADKSTGLRCDQTIVLTGEKAKTNYPQPLRRVKYHDTQHDKTYDFLTNNVVIPAKTVADLYRHRWKVELFFGIKKGLAAPEFRNG